MHEQFKKDNSRMLLVKVYVDQDNNKYLDEQTIIYLLGEEQLSEYKDKDRQSYISSKSNIINKGIPKDMHYNGQLKSNSLIGYEYDSSLNLYRLTEEELYDLLKNYEMTHHGIVIKIDYEYIEKKEDINKEEHLNEMLKSNNNKKDFREINNNNYKK